MTPLCTHEVSPYGIHKQVSLLKLFSCFTPHSEAGQYKDVLMWECQRLSSNVWHKALKTLSNVDRTWICLYTS
jgi:hypothetical protein